MQFSDRIGQRIKLHDLHVLITVVQAGSMNKAASLLHTTQPAVSKSVKELERTVGVRLLERSAKGVEPRDKLPPSHLRPPETLGQAIAATPPRERGRPIGPL